MRSSKMIIAIKETRMIFQEMMNQEDCQELEVHNTWMKISLMKT